MIKVPHQLSLETGYRNVFSLIDRSGVMNGNSATHGVGALFDYGWQVSGLTKNRLSISLYLLAIPNYLLTTPHQKTYRCSITDGRYVTT